MRSSAISRIGAIVAVVAVAGGWSPLASAAGDWTGAIRCEITAEAPGYSHHEIQTWTLTGEPPVIQGSVHAYPATWTVTGQGTHDRTRNANRRVAQWTVNIPGPNAPVRAPIGFTLTPTGQINVTKWHAQLTASGGYTGTDQVFQQGVEYSTQRLVATVYEWQFPKIEDLASVTQLSGSHTAEVRAQVGPLQPADAQVIIRTTWSLAKGTAAPLPPPVGAPSSGTPPATPPAQPPGSPPPPTTPPATTPPPTSPPGSGQPPSSPPGALPVAVLDGPTQVEVGRPVTFSAVRSQPGVGSIHQYNWIVSLGSQAGSVVTDVPTYTFTPDPTRPLPLGPHTARLTVVNGLAQVSQPVEHTYTVIAASVPPGQPPTPPGGTPPGGPRIVSISPTSIEQGAFWVNMELVGEGTHWDIRTTRVDFGPGVHADMGGGGSDATVLRAPLHAAWDAAPGPRTITVTTGAEVVTLPNAITVVPRERPIVTQITPNSARAGDQNVTLRFTGRGTRWKQADGDPGAGQRTRVYFRGDGITSRETGWWMAFPTVASPTEMTVVIDIDPATVPQARDILVSNGGPVDGFERIDLPGGFTVLPRPASVTLGPNTAPAGATNVLVTVTGQNTAFPPGGTYATFQSSSMAFHPVVNVVSPTSATFTLNLTPPLDAPQTWEVIIQYGSNAMYVNGGFTVTPPPAGIPQAPGGRPPIPGRPPGGGFTELPAGVDPANFAAMQTDEGRVELRWDAVPGVSTYLVLGPGAGDGLRVSGTSATVANVPVGLQTWTVTSWYEPDGSRTAAASWPRAQTTVTTNRGRYRVTATHAKFHREEPDNRPKQHGRNNEIQFSAHVQVVDRGTGGKSSYGDGEGGHAIWSVVHGDINNASVTQTSWRDYARIQAGSVSGAGGIQTGDDIRIWNASDRPAGAVVTPAEYVPFVLFEGEIRSGAEVVLVRPVVWLFTGQIGSRNQFSWPLSVRYGGERSFDVLALPAIRNAIDVTGLVLLDVTVPELSTTGQWLVDQQRPFGLDVSANVNGAPATWRDRVVVLTREKIESFLGGQSSRELDVRFSGVMRGTNAIPLGDCSLYLRIERLP